MSTLQQINTGELDFSEIKQNLKTFLQGQSVLADYDFDGSVLSTVLDVLAFNTHYNALYNNMTINEAFIDSASKRASLISIAKLMGYVPSSVTSASAIIGLEISTPNTDNSNIYTLPAGTTFAAAKDGTTYTFNLMQDVTMGRVSSTDKYIMGGYAVLEGSPNKITYTSGAGVHFVIPDRACDTKTISVSVYNPTTLQTTVFTQANSLVGVRSTDNVYFVKQREDLFYEIYFGNGSFGQSIPSGATVTIKYLASSGEAANDSGFLVYTGGGNPDYTYTVTTEVVAGGGASEETKDSIRFNAPLAHQAQDRIVSANDYTALLMNYYPSIESVSVWGGQDNNPPQYGKVFIAAKPFNRDAFSTVEKNNMTSGIIAKKNIITVTPVFVDPIYLDVELVTNVYYDPAKTTLTPGQLATNVRDTISQYSSTLSKFESAFRYSYVSTKIDETDEAIVSNITNIRIRHPIDVVYGITNNYIANMGNPVAKSDKPTFYSTRFYQTGITNRCYLENSGTDIRLIQELPTGTPVDMGSVGTLDFENGIITANGLNIVSLYDAKFEFVFYPSSFDVVPLNRYIVRLPADKVTVNMIVDTLSQTRAAKTSHIFTASR